MARPPAAVIIMAVRQSYRSTTRRNGAWPNTPPAMPIIMARPLNSAKRRAGNHWPATAMAPTKTERRRRTDEEAPGGNAPECRAHREQNAAERTHAGSRRHEAARTEPIHHHADRNLHAGIAVEVEGREIADGGRADGEVAHQLLDHDAGRDAHHPRVEKEQGAGQPTKIGKGSCGPSYVLDVHSRSPLLFGPCGLFAHVFDIWRVITEVAAGVRSANPSPRIQLRDGSLR